MPIGSDGTLILKVDSDFTPAERSYEKFRQRFIRESISIQAKLDEYAISRVIAELQAVTKEGVKTRILLDDTQFRAKVEELKTLKFEERKLKIDADIEDAKKRIATLSAPQKPVVITITADEALFKAQIEKLKTLKLEEKKLTIQADITAMEKKIKDLKFPPTVIPIAADEAAYQAKIKQLTSIKHEAAKIQVDADIAAAQRKLAELKSPPPIVVPVSPDEVLYRAKLAQLEKIKIQTQYIKIDADIKDAEAGLAKLRTGEITATKKSFTELGESMSQLGRNLSLFVSAPIGAGFAASIKAASDLNEQANVTRVVFGNAGDEVLKFSANAAKGLGLSDLEAQKLTGSLGAMLHATGATQEQLATLSIDLAKRVADIGSLYNKSNEEVLLSIQGGLAGYSRALRNVKVFINENTTAQEAFRLGLAHSKAELTEGDKILSRYSLVMKQTALASGDFERTLGTSLANQLKVTRAEITNAASSIGEIFIPVVKSAASGIGDVANALAHAPAGVQALVASLGTAAAAAGPVVFGLGAVAKAAKGLKDLQAAEGLAGSIAGIIGPAALAVTAIGAIGGVLLKLHADQQAKEMRDVADSIRAVAKSSEETSPKIIVEAQKQIAKIQSLQVEYVKLEKAAREAQNAPGTQGLDAQNAFNDIKAKIQSAGQSLDKYKGEIKQFFTADTFSGAVQLIEQIGEVAKKSQDPNLIKFYTDMKKEAESWALAQGLASSTSASSLDVVKQAQEGTLNSYDDIIKAIAQHQAESTGQAKTVAQVNAELKNQKTLLKNAADATRELPEAIVDAAAGWEDYAAAVKKATTATDTHAKSEVAVREAREKATDSTNSRINSEYSLADAISAKAERELATKNLQSDLIDLQTKRTTIVNGLGDATRAAAKADTEAGRAGVAYEKSLHDKEKTLQEYADAQTDAKTAGDKLAEAQKHLDEIVHGVATTTAEAIKSMRAWRDAQVEVTTAEFGVEEAQANLAEAIEKSNHQGYTAVELAKEQADAAKKVKAAQEDLAQASRAVIDAQKGVEDALKGVTSAEKDVETAHKTLKDAEKDETDAKKDAESVSAEYKQTLADLAQVTRGYSSDTKEAEDATRNLQRAQRGQESSVLDLADAKDRLAEATAKANSHGIGEDGKVDKNFNQAKADRDVARAKIALAEAEDRVREAAEKSAEQQAKTNEVLHGAKAGSDAYAAAQEKVAAAAAKVEEAQKKVSAAHQKVLDDQQKIIDAEDKVKDAHDKVTDALQKKADANQKVIDAQAKVAEASIVNAANGYEEAKAKREIEKAELALEVAKNKVVDAQEKQNEAEKAYKELTGGYAEGSDKRVAAQDALAAAAKTQREAKEKVAEFEATWGTLARANQDVADKLTDREQKKADAAAAHLKSDQALPAVLEDIRKKEDAIATAKDSQKRSEHSIVEARIALDRSRREEKDAASDVLDVVKQQKTKTDEIKTTLDLHQGAWVAINKEVQEGILKAQQLKTPYNEAQLQVDAINKAITIAAKSGDTALVNQLMQDLQHIKPNVDPDAIQNFKTHIDNLNAYTEHQKYLAKVTTDTTDAQTAIDFFNKTVLDPIKFPHVTLSADPSQAVEQVNVINGLVKEFKNGGDPHKAILDIQDPDSHAHKVVSELVENSKAFANAGNPWIANFNAVLAEEGRARLEYMVGKVKELTDKKHTAQVDAVLGLDHEQIAKLAPGVIRYITEYLGAIAAGEKPPEVPLTLQHGLPREYGGEAGQGPLAHSAGGRLITRPTAIKAGEMYNPELLIPLTDARRSVDLLKQAAQIYPETVQQMVNSMLGQQTQSVPQVLDQRKTEATFVMPPYQDLDQMWQYFLDRINGLIPTRGY